MGNYLDTYLLLLFILSVCSNRGPWFKFPNLKINLPIEKKSRLTISQFKIQHRVETYLQRIFITYAMLRNKLEKKIEVLN